jgi:hypothetical protein
MDNSQNDPDVKRVKSTSSARNLNAKRVKSPKVNRLGSPVTSCPMMRLVVSPVVMGARSPAMTSHAMRRSQSRSPTPPSLTCETRTHPNIHGESLC